MNAQQCRPLPPEGSPSYRVRRSCNAVSVHAKLAFVGESLVGSTPGTSDAAPHAGIAPHLFGTWHTERTKLGSRIAARSKIIVDWMRVWWFGVLCAGCLSCRAPSGVEVTNCVWGSWSCHRARVEQIRGQCALSGSLSLPRTGTLTLNAPGSTLAAAYTDVVAAAGVQNPPILALALVESAQAFILRADKVELRLVVVAPNAATLWTRPDQKWTLYFALAHELGHHVEGHPITRSGVDVTEGVRQFDEELVADRFAGLQLARLGADRSDIDRAVTSIQPRDSSNYPDARTRAVSAGAGFLEYTTSTSLEYRRCDEGVAAACFRYSRETREFCGPIDGLNDPRAGAKPGGEASRIVEWQIGCMRKRACIEERATALLKVDRACRTQPVTDDCVAARADLASRSLVSCDGAVETSL